MKRFALVSNDYPTSRPFGNDLLIQTQDFLPSNYSASLIRTDEGGLVVLIEGFDNCGWTLDDYVIPRLQTTGIHAVEATTEGGLRPRGGDPRLTSKEDALNLCYEALTTFRQLTINTGGDISQVTQLPHGEFFWDVIEQAIKAAKAAGAECPEFGTYKTLCPDAAARRLLEHQGDNDLADRFDAMEAGQAEAEERLNDDRYDSENIQ